METAIRKLAGFFLLLFVALGLYLTYIQIIRGPLLAAHPLNRRNWELAQAVRRGSITDRHGQLLAESVPQTSEGRTVYRRVYPGGYAFAHLTGFDSPRLGKTGLEGAYNGDLSGMNNPLYRLGAISHLWGTQPGKHLRLTLDASLQWAAYRALGANRGAVVVLDPRTGEILAMVSKPAFDPGTVDKNWETVSTDPASPLLNRALQGLYPPGSAMKVVVAAAAWEEKIADSKKKYQCVGKLQIGRDYVLPEPKWVAHGTVDLERALAVSCNVTFGQIGLQLGRDRYRYYLERFGFTSPLELGLPAEVARLPNFARLGDGDLAQAAIGQGEMLVTPLSMAVMTAAIAHKGVMMQPHLVAEITDSRGRTEKTVTPQRLKTSVSAATADTIKQMMVVVVREGTGTAARMPGIAVAGKTGTAENPHGPPHAWFVGLAPADAPRVVIAVVVENAGSGGNIAAPVARAVLEQAL